MFLYTTNTMAKKKQTEEQELEELRHKHHMIEIKAEKEAKLEVENIKHENELTRQRIKSAEIRKNQALRYR